MLNMWCALHCRPQMYQWSQGDFLFFSWMFKTLCTRCLCVKEGWFDWWEGTEQNQFFFWGEQHLSFKNQKLSCHKRQATQTRTHKMSNNRCPLTSLRMSHCRAKFTHLLTNTQTYSIVCKLARPQPLGRICADDLAALNVLFTSSLLQWEIVSFLRVAIMPWWKMLLPNGICFFLFYYCDICVLVCKTKYDYFVKYVSFSILRKTEDVKPDYTGGSSFCLFQFF